ncbi:hypothetical protein L596_000480 [Steinernema carpocapsae]|uniref:Uncharacterized protein n=1 Tax=Steinernema carpocapsae TaxID=34508 RepID=A0A4U8UMG8_STECR|nr:hypothetical protein L596_000480 [Steinernema carpocapsae]
MITGERRPPSAGQNFEDFFDRSFHHEFPDGIHFEGSTVDSFCCFPPPRIHARYVRKARFQFSAASTRKCQPRRIPKKRRSPPPGHSPWLSVSFSGSSFWARLPARSSSAAFTSASAEPTTTSKTTAAGRAGLSPANPSPSTVSAKMGRALESELGPFTE